MKRTPATGTGPVGIGVVGAGTIGAQYLANMATYPDLNVRFVADLLPDRARGYADRFGVPGWGTVADALARDDVELIVNLTVPAAHAEVASASLAAGKHVWNEKPLTVDRESAQRLVDQADTAGLLLGCAPDTVLGPGLQTALRIIGRGDIGRPLTASVIFQNPGPDSWHPSPDFLFQAGGGPLFDVGPYFLTTLTRVFGAISGVFARGSSASPTRTIRRGPRAGEAFAVTVPTYVTAIFDFETGATAQTTFSFDSPLGRVGVVEVAGTDATLATPDPNQFDGNTRLIRAGASDWVTIRATGVVGARGIGVVDMARALRSGGRHHATGRVGLHIVDAMIATAESIERRAWVAVESGLEPTDPLPEDWDPTARTV